MSNTYEQIYDEVKQTYQILRDLFNLDEIDFEQEKFEVYKHCSGISIFLQVKYPNMDDQKFIDAITNFNIALDKFSLHIIN